MNTRVPIAYALLTRTPNGPLMCAEVRRGDGEFDWAGRYIKPLYERDMVEEAEAEAAQYQKLMVEHD